jgi:hypothetical protein
LTSSAGKAEDPQKPVLSAPEALAHWLLTYEAGEKKRPEELAAAGERVYLRLREHLAVLLGSDGYDALWARAMHLAQRKFSAGDDAVTTESFPTDGSRADGLQAAVRGRDSDAVQHNLMVVFASFITLLFTFIGEELGFRFIRQIWSDLPPDAAVLRADGVSHE